MSENGKPEEPCVLVVTITLYPDETVGCEMEGFHLPRSSRHLSRMFAMAHENLGEVLGRLMGSGDATGAGFTVHPSTAPTGGQGRPT